MCVAGWHVSQFVTATKNQTSMASMLPTYSPAAIPGLHRSGSSRGTKQGQTKSSSGWLCRWIYFPCINLAEPKKRKTKTLINPPESDYWNFWTVNILIWLILIFSRIFTFLLLGFFMITWIVLLTRVSTTPPREKCKPLIDVRIRNLLFLSICSKTQFWSR